MFSLSEAGSGADQEGAGGLAALVGQDVDVGESSEVVGGDVNELKPLFGSAERSAPRDAVSDPIEAAQALDIDVNQLSGPFLFIAHRQSPGAALA